MEVSTDTIFTDDMGFARKGVQNFVECAAHAIFISMLYLGGSSRFFKERAVFNSKRFKVLLSLCFVFIVGANTTNGLLKGILFVGRKNKRKANDCGIVKLEPLLNPLLIV